MQTSQFFSFVFAYQPGTSQFTYIFFRLLFGLLAYLIFQAKKPDLLSYSTPAPSNLLLHLNLNIILNPKMTVYDTYNEKY